MIILEEIINKIINLDNKAKEKIKTIKEKEEKIESYINEQLQIEKDKIDGKFLYKKKNIQEKYDKLFEDRRQKLDQEKQNQIININQKYEQEKQKIIDQLLKSII